jgi:hypothetical protein
VKGLVIFTIALVTTVGAKSVQSHTLSGHVGRGYKAYQREIGPKAFAWNGVDAFGYSYKAVSAEAAASLALKSCELARKELRAQQANAAPCQILDHLDTAN